MHQCVHFAADPCKEHEEVIEYLVRHILKNHHLGFRFLLTKQKDVNEMLMHISVETGTYDLHSSILSLCFTVSSASKLQTNLHFLPLKLSTFLCLCL